MTSYASRLYLKGRVFFLASLLRGIIDALIIPVRLVFLIYYSYYSAGWIYRLNRLGKLDSILRLGSMMRMTEKARLTRMISLARTHKLSRGYGWGLGAR